MLNQVNFEKEPTYPDLVEQILHNERSRDHVFERLRSAVEGAAPMLTNCSFYGVSRKGMATWRGEAHRIKNWLHVERVAELVLIEECHIIHISVGMW